VDAFGVAWSVAIGTAIARPRANRGYMRMAVIRESVHLSGR
jgi:hypothetical protein